MTEPEFRRAVDESVAALPPKFRDRLANVAILVRDRPTRDDLAAAGVPAGDTLYGLFAGTAEPDKSGFDVAPLPDRIVLFRRPLERDFPAPAELRRQIRVTVVHELGHLFGLSESEIDRLGYA